MAQFARIVSMLLSIFNILIVVRVVLTWMSVNRPKSEFETLLGSIVDPYLNLFRSLDFLNRGPLDFTPLAAIVSVSLVQRIFYALSLTRKFSFNYLIATIIEVLWSGVGSLVLGILIILLGVRLYFTYRRSPNTITYIAILDSWLKGPINFIHRSFYKGEEVSDRNLLWTTLGVAIAFYILLSLLIGYLISLLM